MNSPQTPEDLRLSQIYQQRKAQNTQTKAQKQALKQALDNKLAQSEPIKNNKSLWLQPQLWGSTVAAALVLLIIVNYQPNLDTIKESTIPTNQPEMASAPTPIYEYKETQIELPDKKRAIPPPQANTVSPMAIDLTAQAESAQKVADQSIESISIEVASVRQPEPQISRLNDNGYSGNQAAIAKTEQRAKTINNSDKLALTTIQLQIIKQENQRIIAKDCKGKHYLIPIKQLSISQDQYKVGDWIQARLIKNEKIDKISRPLAKLKNNKSYCDP